MSAPDTIAAVATPPGVGGVGIVRISGPRVKLIAAKIVAKPLPPRYAVFASFIDGDDHVIDEGIALYFTSPHSFTGEDVLELQAHGGPVILDLLLARSIELGARPARPGEFSERAFHNGKLDLLQAESIIDLIESANATAARLALRTLQGEFSRRIHSLVANLIQIRAFVEAAVDFPEEEIDFLSESSVISDASMLAEAISATIASAHQGQLLRDGITLVIAGRPNAGKSSLLNALSGTDSAIVTDIPGTTRDVLRERIQLDGLPLHVVDTAGLRDAADIIESEGIRRARDQIRLADRVLWVFDDQGDSHLDELERSSIPPDVKVTLIRNKIDLTTTPPGQVQTDGIAEFAVSAKTGFGIPELKNHLKKAVGYSTGEGEFIARRRHIQALSRALNHVKNGIAVMQTHAAAELFAEEMRLAQNALSEITGEYLPDDLLGEIFGRFCIGK